MAASPARSRGPTPPSAASRPGPGRGRADPAVEPLAGRWGRYIRNKGAARRPASIFVASSLFCHRLADHLAVRPERGRLRRGGQGPSLEHPFGTDRFGRDLLTRAALGGRVSIGIGFAATFVILVIGVTYGSISGFVGGRLDNAMMRFLDALYGLPYLPFAIITLAIFGDVTFWTMVIALSIASWFTTARIVRGQVITLKENDYVRAAKAVGARWYRVLGRHLLPNTLGVLIIAVFLELPGVILGEAFLSFIGLGISPPEASWGRWRRTGVRSTASTRTSSSSRASRSRRSSCARTSSPTGCATRSTPDAGDPAMALLEVDDLQTHFFTREGVVRAVDGVTFSLDRARRSGSSASPGAASR